MRTMQALVKKRSEPGLWLDEVPAPTIGINDVLIQVLRTGICGTDLHIYKWDAWAQKTVPVPMVVGHEFVGRIVEAGSNVKDFHIGEIVSGEGHVVCGRCRNCLAGRRHLCKDTQGIGVNRPGAFAEYIALPMTNVWVHETPPSPPSKGGASVRFPPSKAGASVHFPPSKAGAAVPSPLSEGEAAVHSPPSEGRATVHSPPSEGGVGGGA